MQSSKFIRSTFPSLFTKQSNLFRYRLAPEHRFPSALEDCYSVSREFFTHSHRIILSGDSAGGNLALAVTQRLIQSGYQPYLLCLLYPSLQFFDFTLPSYQTYLKRNILGMLNEENLLSMVSLLDGKTLPINRDILSNSHVSFDDHERFYPYMNRTKYLSVPHQFNRSHSENETLINQYKYLLTPSMSPLLVSDEQLMQLPITLLFTTEFDIVRDEGKTNTFPSLSLSID